MAQEDLIDSVTAVSGSGPAYLFLMAEAMTEAGIAEGLQGCRRKNWPAPPFRAGAGALLAADRKSRRRRCAKP